MADEDEDERFEELLVAFKAEHERRTRSLEAHMLKAKAILESETDGLQQSMNVKHAPILHRLKDADKALRTLRRRQEDRKQLRDLKHLVEERGHRWDEYCKEWNMTDKINEAEPFTDTEQMFKAMHDLAGIRISVYFPSDVQKVVEFLRGKHFRIVEEPSRKGGLTRDFQKVRNLVERQRQIHAASVDKRKDMERMVEAGSAPELTFAGYKATHVVVRLKKLDFDKHARGDSITNIEVQIGSIVMHAWSDIEHDILYKPSGKDKTSPEVVRMLDLINGIVMTGEVALQQLASVAAAEATRQAASRTKPADNWHHVVPWFYTYFKNLKVDMPLDINWLAPRYMFDILQSTNDHNYGRLEALLNNMNPPPKPEPRLPYKVLNSLGSDVFDDPSFKPPKYATTWSARYWVTCLVNTVNLALYMDLNPFRLMWDYSSKNNSQHTDRPTFAELLDILHPTKPQRRPNREDQMIEFCKHALATNFNPDSSGFTAVRLAAAGYVVRPPLSKDEEKDLPNPSPVFVPALLKGLTRDNNTIFRVVLGVVGEGVPYDRHHYFIPCKDGTTWKPVRYQSGRKWFIAKKYPFTNDLELVFNAPKAQWGYFTNHLCSVLGITTDSGEIRTLGIIASKLVTVNDVDKVRSLHKIITTLGTKDTDKILPLLELPDVKDVEALAELAELARVLDTMDAGELGAYRSLSRSQGTKEADELRALKQIAEENNIDDPKTLKALRENQREAEGSVNWQGRRASEDTDQSSEQTHDEEDGDVADTTGVEDSSDYCAESQSTQQTSREDLGEQRWRQEKQRAVDEQGQTTPTRECAEQSWQQQCKGHEQRHSQQEEEYNQHIRQQPVYDSDDECEAQRRYRPLQNQQQQRKGNNHDGASSDSNSDSRWHNDDMDDDTEPETSAGADQRSQHVDEEGQPDSKREKLLKGIGALKTSWNKYKR